MTPEKRKVILLIDNAGDFIGLFKRVLEREGLASEFVCEEVIPSGSSILEDSLGKISEILKRVKEVEVVLVDIVLDESVKPTEKQIHIIDRSGFQLAAELRKQLPNTPILGITQWTRVQMLLTDVTLDDNFDGLLLKGVLTGEGFSRNRFLEYLEKAKRKRANGRRTHSSIGPRTSSSETVARGERLSRLQISNDPITQFQVDEIGESTLDGILYQAFGNGEGNLRYFVPGFSGSKLFEVSGRINPDGYSQSGVTSWIVKLSTDASNLQVEIDKHKGLKSRGVSKEFYPLLLSEELFADGGWHAIITEKDPKAITLRKYIQEDATGSDFKEVLEVSIKKVLSQLYGNARQEKKLIWQRFYGMKTHHIAAIRASLDQLTPIFQHQANLSKPQIERIDQFVVTGGMSHRSIHEYEQDVDVRYIHGDFHSRNILVNPEPKTITTIDFPNSQQDHAVRDFAKLDADIIFSVMASEHGDDTNWSSMNAWSPVVDSLSLTNLFEPPPSGSSEELLMVSAIRACAKSMLNGISWQEYLLAFLYYSLRLLQYPDITLPKKSLVITCANKILDQFA